MFQARIRLKLLIAAVALLGSGCRGITEEPLVELVADASELDLTEAPDVSPEDGSSEAEVAEDVLADEQDESTVDLVEDGEEAACDGTHASWYCVGSDVYWFDACGEREELKEPCSRGCSVDACVPEPTGFELELNFVEEFSAAPPLCDAELYRSLYRGRATLTDRNVATLELVRCDGLAFDFYRLWVIPTGSDLFEEGNLAKYTIRLERTVNDETVGLADEGRLLSVSKIPIWPSELDLVHASCDAVKYMAIITDRAGSPNERHYYQYQSVAFRKRCF